MTSSTKQYPPFIVEYNEENGEIDEKLLSDIVERAPEMQWIYTILHQSEEEALAMLRENPKVLQECNKTYCIKDQVAAGYDGCLTNDMETNGICICPLETEVLMPTFSRKTMLQRIIVNTFVGACPHVFAMISSNHTILNNTFLRSKLTWHSSLLNINSLTSLKEEFSQHVNQYMKKVNEWRFHPGVIFSCAGSLLSYAAQLDKVSLVRYLIEENTLTRSYRKYPNCIGITLMTCIIQNKSIQTLRMLNESGNIDRVQDMFRMEWDTIYSEYLYPLLFDTERDFVLFEEFLKFLTKYANTEIIPVDFLKISLCYCFSKGMRHSITHLIDKGATLKQPECERRKTRMHKILKDLQTQEKIVKLNNDEILKLYLKSSPEESELRILFERAVFLGGVHQVRIILSDQEPNIQPLLKDCKVRPVTLALIRESVSMLTYLLESKTVESLDFENEVNKCLSRNSLYTWATLLDLKECAHVLDCHGFKKDISIHINPFIEFLIEFHKSSHIQVLEEQQRFGPSSSLKHIVQKLINNTYSSPFINSVEDLQYYCRTPVQLAIENRKFDLAEILMLHGADPFSDLETLTSNLSTEVLTNIYHCNVDCSNQISAIFKYYLFSDKEIFFVLEVECRLTPQDKHALISNYMFLERMRNNSECESENLLVHTDDIVGDFSGQGKENGGCLSEQLLMKWDNMVTRYFCTPKTLMRCCRDVLRHNFRNIQIFRFVEVAKLPQKLKRYLLIENEIEECVQELFTLEQQLQFNIKL